MAPTTVPTEPRQAPSAAMPLVVGGVLALAIGLPSLRLPFGVDQGQQAAIGRMMAGGRTLYRDIWDNRPPGIYVLAAFAWKAGLRGMRGLRALDLAWQVATALALGLLACRLWRGRWVGLVAAALYALAYYGLELRSQGQINTAEVF